MGTSQNPIQRGMALIQEGYALLGGVFNFGQMGQTGTQQASVGAITRRRTKASSRRRTSAHARSTATTLQPVAVQGQQGQQAKPKRHLSRAARQKLSAAAKARWAQRKAA